MTSLPDDRDHLEPPATLRGSVPGILVFGIGMLAAAAGVVAVLAGVVNGPGWLTAAGVAACIVGLGVAFLGMVLLYRSVVRAPRGPRHPGEKK